MKASDARKRTDAGKKAAAKKIDDARLAKEQKYEKGREFARKEFEESYAKVVEQIQTACDDGRSSTTYHDTIYTTSEFNHGNGKERVNLIEGRLKADGYTVIRRNEHTRVQANEGQDDPAVAVDLEISW